MTSVTIAGVGINKKFKIWSFSIRLHHLHEWIRFATVWILQHGGFMAPSNFLTSIISTDKFLSDCVASGSCSVEQWNRETGSNCKTIAIRFKSHQNRCVSNLITTQRLSGCQSHLGKTLSLPTPSPATTSPPNALCTVHQIM